MLSDREHATWDQIRNRFLMDDPGFVQSFNAPADLPPNTRRRTTTAQVHRILLWCAGVLGVLPDEARTFGMDALFPSKKIYSPHGQRYLSVDRDLLLSYQEDLHGVLLYEGITEAGSVASWTAVGTS